jgi:hypothetical protein
MLSGCTMCSASACAMSSCSWLNVALSSPMRLFGAGAGSSAAALPTACAADGPGTGGTWTRCSSGCRRAALSLARRGSARRCARHPRSGAPRCQCRQALLQAPAEATGLCAAGDGDRQAEKLRRGKAPPASRRRAATKPISEQSRRKFTLTDTASGTADAKVQIARTGPGLPVRSRIHPWPLPPTPPSAGS